MNTKKYLFPIIYSAVLFAFTLYVLLDTFVIVRVYSNDTASARSDYSSNEGGIVDQSDKTDIDTTNNDTPIITENSYSDSNINITLTEYREYDTQIYVADIKISNAELLGCIFANDSYGRNVTEKTSEMSKRCSAILAINGDNYGSRQTGYVIRNSTLYRAIAVKDQEDLVIYSDGRFDIINEKSTSANEILDSGAMHVLSFGPALVYNGQISVSQNDEVGKAMASNPRTAICQISELHYLFICSDGRTNESEGLTLYQLADFAKKLGAETAYNLDGGGSSTMYFNGRIVNNPTTNGKTIKERSVSDIVYIGY